MEHNCYIDTRGNVKTPLSFTEALVKGLAQGGGLFVPQNLPSFGLDEIIALADLPYAQRAAKVYQAFDTDLDDETIERLMEATYGAAFDTEDICPVTSLDEKTHVLELWHGPTSAFKDMALQCLPNFFSESARKLREEGVIDHTFLILVATSGDTGKAALEGFKDKDGIQIAVMYPDGGVSDIQYKQMATQEGSNVNVWAVSGNFDDCQNGVKAIFTDKAIADRLAKNNILLSSANSINWGRLAPQIVYYVSTYAELLKNKEIEYGEKINVVVPTGNFGNILAAYYAREMGLPVDRLICASNKNRVLTDFFDTGVYDINRSFYTTSSPSMDILISSNLERLLFIASGYSDEFVREMMGDLKQKGKYIMPENVMSAINSVFCAGCCDDEGTKETIKKTFEDYGYLCDTHTAVGINVYEKYAEKTGDKTPTVIDSTANPFKFSRSVLDAVEPGASEGLDEFSMVGELARVTKTSCPPQLADLRDKPVRFRDVCDRDSMEKAVFRLLGI